MKKWIAIGVVVALIVIGAVALTRKSNTPQPAASSSQSSSSASDSTNPTSGNITIKDMMFTPSQITVAKGGTVTWTNDDTIAHTVVDDLSGVGGPNSGNIASGATYSFTFTKVGSFQYHCNLHPSMRGTIVVK
jgi:plastocyanin